MLFEYRFALIVVVVVVVVVALEFVLCLFVKRCFPHFTIMSLLKSLLDGSL